MAMTIGGDHGCREPLIASSAGRFGPLLNHHGHRTGAVRAKHRLQLADDGFRRQRALRSSSQRWAPGEPRFAADQCFPIANCRAGTERWRITLRWSALLATAVSREQLREGSAASSRNFDSTTAGVCGTVKHGLGADW